MSKRASLRKKPAGRERPLVIKIAEEDNISIGYLEMLNAFANNTEIKDLLTNSELRRLSCCRDITSTVKLNNGTRLVVKNESEILILKSMRAEMTKEGRNLTKNKYFREEKR